LAARKFKAPPKSIMVMGHRIKVTVKANLMDGDSELEGYFDYSKRTIFLSLRSPCLRSTLLHEVLHSVLYFSGHSTHLSAADEEALVLALEHGLMPLLKVL